MNPTIAAPIRAVLGARLADGTVVDIELAGGEIASIAPASGRRPVDALELEMPGCVVLQAPAEPHAHLDKAGSAALAAAPGRGLEGAVRSWLEIAATSTVDDFAERARAQLTRYLRAGTTAVRSHVDILSGPEPLRGVEALVRVREEFRGLIDLQLVALPEQSIALEHIERALDLGVDLVGGAPHRAPQPAEDLDRLIDLAERRGIGVDLHTDEGLDGEVTLLHFARRVRDWPADRLRAAGHCVRLGTLPATDRDHVIEAAAEAGIAVIALPQTNLFLQGWDAPVSTPRGITAVRALLMAGAIVAGGGDNVQDPFNPMGRSDALETASLLVSAAHLSVEEAYHAVSAGARRTMGLASDGIQVGAPAELLIVRGNSLADAVARGSEHRAVIHDGRLVAKTEVTSSIAASSA
ncbi:amidohydrolase family protein [uncultured Microbacterium sp.]|uniref:amidohydrolase family protein n=1 Tax=uncultured Microbacterium sp. TaxID=191216 RepID=UPI0035CAD15F